MDVENYDTTYTGIDVGDAFPDFPQMWSEGFRHDVPDEVLTEDVLVEQSLELRHVVFDVRCCTAFDKCAFQRAENSSKSSSTNFNTSQKNWIYKNIKEPSQIMSSGKVSLST